MNVFESRRRKLIVCMALFALAYAVAADAPKSYEKGVQAAKEEAYPAAVIHLRNALQEDARYVPAWVLLADIYLRMGDAPIAITSAEKALELGADSRHVALILARAHLLRGDFEELKAMRPPRGASREDIASFLVVQANGLFEAHEYVPAAAGFEQALEVVPDHSGALRGLALTRSRQRRPEVALRLAERAVEVAPQDDESWYVQGEVQRASHDPEAALASFARARDLEPRHAPALLGEAAVLSDLGRVEDAHLRLLEHHEIAPEDIQGLVLLAQVQMTLGDSAGAADSLASARNIVNTMTTELRQRNLPALMTTALLALRDGDVELARGSLSRYLDLQPGHRGARRLLAMTFLRLNQPLEARRLLSGLVRDIPADPYLKVMLASAHALAGETARAEQLFEEANLASIGNSWIHQVIGIAQARGGQAGAALAAFERALALNEDHDDARLMSVYMQLQLGQLDDARASMERLLARYPANPLFYNLSGALRLMSGERAAAEQDFLRAVDVAPDYPPALMNLAELARQRGDLAAAREKLAALLDVHPRHVGAMNGLAEIELAAGDTAAAIVWLERIKKISPENADNRIVLLNAYRHANRQAAALADARELRQLASDDARAVVTVAYVEAEAGNRAVARSDLIGFASRPRASADELDRIALAQTRLRFHADAEATRYRIIARWPDHVLNRYRLARRLLAEGRLAAAETHVAFLSRHAAEEVQTHVVVAELATARGDHAAAVVAYRAANELRPGNTMSRRLAMALQANGETQAAIELLAARVAEAPTDQKARMGYAEVLLKVGRTDEAIAMLQAIVEQEPDNWRAHNNLAWALLPRDSSAALRAARTAVELAPRNPATLDTAGWVIAQAGDTEQGLRLLREAAARESSSPQIRLHLAEVLMQSQRYAEARELLQSLDAVRDDATTQAVSRLEARLPRAPPGGE